MKTQGEIETAKLAATVLKSGPVQETLNGSDAAPQGNNSVITKSCANLPAVGWKSYSAEAD
jgi:hypothetical protein